MHRFRIVNLLSRIYISNIIYFILCISKFLKVLKKKKILFHNYYSVLDVMLDFLS